MHVKKAIAGAALLSLPASVLFAALGYYFTQCYDILGNRLFEGDSFEEENTCSSATLGISIFLMALMPVWVGGAWLLVFGLAGRSLVSGKKEADSRLPSYPARIMGGVALVGASIPFIYPPLKEAIYFCQFPDSFVCGMELNRLLITLAIVVPLVLAGILLILGSIKRMYPVPPPERQSQSEQP